MTTDENKAETTATNSVDTEQASATEKQSDAAQAQPVQDGEKAGAAPSPESEIAKLKEDLKRAKAETINTVKRMSAEIEREYLRGTENALNEMPEIVDGLERALETKNSDYDTLRDGVAMILNQFKLILAGQGIEIIEPKPGDRLDPQVHLAISKEESVTFEEHRVVRVVLKGYRHGHRILRPANVVASAPKEASKQETNNEGKEEGNDK